MRIFPQQRSGLLVLILLLLASALTLVQVEEPTPSLAQFASQTSYLPGITTTCQRYTGNRTWTGQWNRTFTWSGNATFTHEGNHTRGFRSWNGTCNGNWAFIRNANLRGHRRSVVPGLAIGWAHSNITLAARNMTQPIILNGTEGVRLGYIAINASSSGQTIRNVAFNGSVAQIEFDNNGSIQLTISSSIKPSLVFADGNLLLEAPSTVGLTPQSEAWVYDPSNQSLIIFADPASVTLIYTPATVTPVPEYPMGLEGALVLVGCLVICILLAKNSRTSPRTAQSAWTTRRDTSSRPPIALSRKM